MSTTLLIAGAGANQIGLFAQARAMGVLTLAVDGNPEACAFAHADHAVQANICDPDVLYALAQEYDVDGVYPAAELSVEAIAEVAQRMDLPGISPLVATRVRHKGAMRRALDAAGLPTPLYREVFTLAEARDSAVEIGFPLIIKPADANSSKGVQRLESLDDLHGAYDSACEYSHSDTVLLEAFMEGEEYCVDGLVHEGRYIPGGITGKERSPLPHRFDTGIHMPPRLAQAECDALEQCAYEALQAVGFTHGTFHLEIIVTDEGPRIVEIAGRPGGGRIPTDLIPLAYGMDFVADSVRIALGQSPRAERQHERAAALYWIDADAGRVETISGADEARALPGVCDVVIQAHPGDALAPIVDCPTRDAVGYVLCEGENTDEAIERAQVARRTCTIHTA